VGLSYFLSDNDLDFSYLGRDLIRCLAPKERGAKLGVTVTGLAMALETQSSALMRFGTFEVDLRAGEVRKQGVKIKLQDHPFRVLTLLLQKPGEVVTREELRNHNWPPDTFVDFDNSLNTAINKLREALGDSADNPRFIETLPRRGYRFIAPVECFDGKRAGRAPLQKTRSLAALKWMVAAAIVVVSIAASIYLLMRSVPPPKVVGSTQITNDAFPKTPVATDGTRLYFTETTSLRQFIAQVATRGGEAAPISSSLPNTVLFAISPSRSELLVGSWTSTELDLPLWILPLPSGPPRRVGNLEAHDATYSSDGTEIIYAKGSDLYRARADGAESQKLMTLASTAYHPRLSPDGKRLRFTLVKGESSWIWESTGNGTNPHPLLSGQNEQSQECCGAWTEDGRFFLFLKGTRAHQALDSMNYGANIWALEEETGLFRNVSKAPLQLTSGPLSFGSLVPSKDGKKIFVGGGQLRAELVSYDSKSRQFVPFASGMSAGETDFSRDKCWWAYVTYPDGQLWRSRLDGTDRLQLTYAPLIAKVPRWSPDGKSLVFVGNDSRHTFEKMFIVLAGGGQPEEVLPEDGADEDDPTWSPDGKSLLFAHYASIASGLAKANIRIVNLETHAVTTLPGSEGMIAPRWSPDGRFVVALSFDLRKIMLYTVSTQKWQELLEGLFVSPNWSSDGRFVYAEDSARKESTILRIRITDHKVEQIAPLKDLRRAFTTDSIWSGVTPDGSPLVMRDIGVQEIYALDVVFP